MFSENKCIQDEFVMMTMEEIVPEDHLLRKVSKYVEFSFIYDEVRDLYCADNGRPGIDPVVLFKLVFIQALDGIKSMRKTCERCQTDAAYRWFLGIPYGKPVPHYSTFSKNYERRFKDSDVFENIFIEIVKQANKYHLVDGTVLYTDSTHKKANANKKKFHMETVRIVKERKRWLEDEINRERLEHGRKELNFKEQIEKKEIKVSDTDEESGYYHRDNKEQGFMYLDHRTVDHKTNIIVDAHITKGNVHDSTPYNERLDHIIETFGFKVEKVALDSGYDSMDIKRHLDERGIKGAIAYRRHGSKESRKRKAQYKYNRENDYYENRETGEILEYDGLVDRNGYKKYRSLDKKTVINRHIYEELNEKFKEYRNSEEGKKLYHFRKEKVERSFADSKQNHGYRYAMYRGLTRNQHYTWLICAAQNMKTIANKMENRKYK